jgi:hypothetical protein
MPKALALLIGVVVIICCPLAIYVEASKYAEAAGKVGCSHCGLIGGLIVVPFCFYFAYICYKMAD